MASIPLPALDIRPQQQPDPMGEVAKLMQMRSMMGQQQMQQQSIQASQQENQLRALQLQDQATLRDSAKNLDWTQPDTFGKWITNAQQKGVSPQTLSQLSLQRAQYQEQLAKTDTATLAAEKDRNNQLQGHIDAIKGITDPVKRASVAQAQASQILSGGLVKDPQMMQGIQAVAQGQHVPSDEELTMMEHGLTDHNTQIEQVLKQQQTATSGAQQKEAEAATSQKLMESKWYQEHGMAPGVPAETMGMADWLKNNPGKGPSDYQIAMKKIVPAFNFNLQSGLLNDQAKDMAAENYFQTGQLPSGARSPAIISAIINRAAELHPGGNLAGNKAAFEANKASYENVTKTLDTLSAFETAGLKNLKQFTDLADKLPDTGIPWANTPVRVLNKNLVGDQWMPAVEAARTVALREIARVTNDPKLSGVLSDSARQEVTGLSPENATLPQIKHVVEILKQDMANVHQGLAQQKQDIGKRLGMGAQPSPSGQETAPAGTDFFSQFGGKQR